MNEERKQEILDDHNRRASDLSESYGSSQPETGTELLKMAIFWMRKSQDYSPPRLHDVGRMLECARYIEERMKEKNK